MFRKIAIAVVVAGLSAGSAFAASTMSDGMKGFFSDDGKMKAEAHVTTMYSGMKAEDQAKLKEECKANKGSVGISEAQQGFCNWLAKMN